MDKHIIRNIKKTIYYEYITLNRYNSKFHLVSIESDGFNCIIPDSYQIDYAQSNNNYNEKGHLYFFNDKYSYCLDYVKKDSNLFEKHMCNKEKDIVKKFTNYRFQKFYELYNNNEYIYMYYEGYYFKLYTNHKMSINEYYDMYLILLSMSKDRISKDIELLKELVYFNENAIYSICNDVDLIKSNLKEFSLNIELNVEDVVVINDDTYLEYKSKQTRVDAISRELLSSIINNDGKNLTISETFKFANLGTYNIIVNDYFEIVDSEELNDSEKSSLIYKMIQQKQNETYSNKDKINNEFYNYIINYLNHNLTYQLWDLYHIREFINVDKYDNITNDEELYNAFMKDILLSSVLNMKLVEDSIKTSIINIYPTKYILRLSIFNGLLNNLKIIFDEEFNLLDLNK